MSYEFNEIARGELQFGLSLMKRLNTAGNVVISPISIRTALAMLYEGAKGESAREIAAAAYLTEDASHRHDQFRAISDALNAAQHPIKLRLANGVWVDKKFKVNPAYPDTLRKHYRAVAESADFEGNSEGERFRINDWGSRITEGLIPEIFPAGSIDDLTSVILVNGLYFEAPWANMFDPKLTQPQDYRLSTGETVKVDMMRKGEVEEPLEGLPKYQYAEIAGAQAVLMPYQGYRLAKLILLPPQGTRVQEVEAYLCNRSMKAMDLLIMMEIKPFQQLEIPKHVARGSYPLKEPLRAMGIDRVFRSGAADLSGIGDDPLFISQGFHQTYFKTDEFGSKGAATTGIAGSRSFEQPVEFVANRPFLEAVIETTTGALLFLNRIEDPR